MTGILSSEDQLRISIIFAESSLGFVLNAAVIIALYKSYRTLTPSNFLYYQLLISDMLFLLIISLLGLINLITRSSHNYFMCQLSGFTVQTFEGMGMALVSLQLLNPLRIIVLETNALSVRQMAWTVSVLWIFLAVLTASMPWISGDEYKLLPSKTWCYTNYVDPRWGALVVLFGTVGLIILMLFVLAVGYIWIYLKMRRYGRGKEDKDKEVQWFIIRRGFLLTCTAFAVWMYPACMLTINKLQGKMENDFYIAVSGTASNVLNPVLLFLSHKKIRKTVYGWFYWVRSREQSSDNTLSSSARGSSSNYKNRPSIAARIFAPELNSPPLVS